MEAQTTSSLHRGTTKQEKCVILPNHSNDDAYIDLLQDRNKTRMIASSSIPELYRCQRRKKYYGSYVISDSSMLFAHLVRSLRTFLSWNKAETQRLVSLSTDNDKTESLGASILRRPVTLLAYGKNKGEGNNQISCQKHFRTAGSNELGHPMACRQTSKSFTKPMRALVAPRRRHARRSLHPCLLAALLALYSFAFVTINVAAQPTVSPSDSPIESPAEVVFPTFSPSKSPTESPTASKSPTGTPSKSPTKSPTTSPSNSPTSAPSKLPTMSPTGSPSASPSVQPSGSPSETPSVLPSEFPSESPSKAPSSAPSETPSVLPSEFPSESPSESPSEAPSGAPSETPSVLPSSDPSSQPSGAPSETPSILPSSDPSSQPSSFPSLIPSNSPTLLHTDVPSAVPSNLPSRSPSRTPSSVPSVIPSSSPSLAPSLQPSLLPSLQPSVQPSSIPSAAPSNIPTVIASDVPSQLPSVLPSVAPTGTPSQSPSLEPSVSLKPSSQPSHEPSLAPSWVPTSEPSTEPTFWVPSVTSVEVVQRFTLAEGVKRIFTAEEIEIFQNLMVSYTIEFGSRKGRDDGRVNVTCTITKQIQLTGRRELWRSWGDNFLTVSQNERKPWIWEYPSLLRRRLSTSFNQVTYIMKYVSVHSETLSYSQGFRDYINGNRTKLVQDMNDAGLDIVTEAEIAFARSETPQPTPTPSAHPSFSPSSTPSSSPTLLPSSSPSLSPSLQPSFVPSDQPSLLPSTPPSLSPSSAPSLNPSMVPSDTPSFVPSNNPTVIPSMTSSSAPSSGAIRTVADANKAPNNDGGSSIPAIAGSAVGGAFVALVLGFFVFRKRKRDNNRLEKPLPGSTGAGHSGSHSRAVSVANDFSQDLKESALNIPPPNSMITPNDPNSVHRERIEMLSVDTSEDRHEALERNISSQDDEDEDSIEYVQEIESPVDEDDAVDMIYTNDTLASNPSLVSPGYSMSSDSGQENDSTHNLADEFDEYKDKNLEEMRTQVESNVTNFDGMMSQALTKALMDDDDNFRDPNELTWGGSGDSTEIEASVLCEMNDWLKKKEGASLDERREFMQETLNKMVASVRYGIIQPEDASRTIHGCAAMLGLQLAEDIPETALIVTGMRKMVHRSDVINSFKEFGEIEDAAVSPNARGFGLVRFKSSKSVQRAMARFRTEEIVVQDVAVMIKVLKSDSPVEPRDFPSVVDLNRHHSGEPRRDRGGPSQPPPAPQRLAMEDSQHVVNLSTIGYSGDSGGRGSESGRGSERSSDRSGRRRYPDPPRPPASDAGSAASVRSRTSNRSHHARNRSGETGSSGSQRRSSRRT